MNWTEESIAALRKYRAEKLSFLVCAKLLTQKFEGNFTRNACIGKAAREKIPGPTHRTGRPRKPKRENTAFPFLQRGKTAVQLARDEARRAALAAVAELNHSIHAVTFDNLDSMHCRWMLGEPSEQMYCGADQIAGSSYCLRHHVVAYTSPKEREAKPFEFRKRAA